MTVSINDAKEQDAGDILALMAEFYAFFNYPFDKDLAADNLSLFISNKNLGKIWIIYDRNLLIGYVVLTLGFSFEYKGITAFVDELYLNEVYRSKGIGNYVMDFIEEHARREGIKALHLEVEKDNLPGERLYLKNGFVDNKRKLLTKYLI